MVSTLRAFVHMATQGRCPAKLYCPESFLLLVSHGVTTFICVAIFTKYILYFRHADTSFQTVSRTLSFVNTGLGNMKIVCSGRKTGVSQKLLDIERIGSRFQSMCSKAMPKHMNVTGFCNSCFSLILFECFFYAPGTQIAGSCCAGKQPVLRIYRSADPPVSP